MELRQLRSFVAVAEDLSFTRAAARLPLAQPALSRQIHDLETELGVRLLDRTRRRVELTGAGHTFLAEARAILARAEGAAQLAQRAQRGEVGRLTIGFVSSAGYAILPRAIRHYREQFPHVIVALRDMSTAAQVHALADGTLDVGVLRPPVARPELTLATIQHDPIIAALPSAHPLAARTQLTVAELADEPFVLFPHGSWTGRHYEDRFAEICHAAGFSPRVVQEAHEMATILGLVAAGIGISVVPNAARVLRAEGVAYRPLAHLAADLDLAFAWRGEASPMVKAFVATTLAIVRAASAP